VILGKTNLSEWANVRSDHATSGWSARGGLVKNPYAFDRSASGSSSGSAVAAAASFAGAALGTETVGSIVSPASACGVVGLKPTVGLVSRAGVIPITHSFDTAGPIARSVADAALVLAAIAGPDPRDPATQNARFEPPRLDRDGARGARIGVVRGLKWVSPEQSALFDAAIDALRSLGAVIVDGLELPRPPFDPAHVVLMRELVTDMRAYLEARGGPMRSLDDLVRFDREHAREEMPWFGQDVFEAALEKGGIEAPDYTPALEACRKGARESGLDPLLAKVDVLVMPTAGPAWTSDLVNGDHFVGGSAFLPAVAGYPHLTVPCGFVHELPVGLSFVGAAWSEATLLRIGFAYEGAARARRPPRLP
jgi:amidase